jgi:hypothetical protein
MPVWHSIFLQEFADGRLRNVNTVPGRMVLSLFPPLVSGDPLAAMVVPSSWYRFEPDISFERVIGVDLTVQVNIPVQSFDAPIVLLAVGDQIQLAARFRIPLEMIEPVTARGSLHLRIADSEFVWSEFPIHHRHFTRLRVQWHTSGQARVWRDGELVAFANDVAAQSKLQAGHVLVGNPTIPPGAPMPRFRLAYLFVRLLRDHDAFPELAKRLPLDLPDDPLLEQCTQQIRGLQLAILDRYRAFMTLFSQKATTNWQAGDPDAPFSPAAVDAHRLAKEVLLAFLRFLQTSEQTDADKALDRCTKFFEVLRLQAPDEFNTLLAELGELPEVSPECRALAERMIAANQPRLEPALRLLQAIFDRVTAG